MKNIFVLLLMIISLISCSNSNNVGDNAGSTEDQKESTVAFAQEEIEDDFFKLEEVKEKFIEDKNNLEFEKQNLMISGRVEYTSLREVTRINKLLKKVTTSMNSYEQYYGKLLLKYKRTSLGDKYDRALIDGSSFIEGNSNYIANELNLLPKVVKVVEYIDGVDKFINEGVILSSLGNSIDRKREELFIKSKQNRLTRRDLQAALNLIDRYLDSAKENKRMGEELVEKGENPDYVAIEGGDLIEPQSALDFQSSYSKMTKTLKAYHFRIVSFENKRAELVRLNE